MELGLRIKGAITTRPVLEKRAPPLLVVLPFDTDFLNLDVSEATCKIRTNP